MNGTEIASAASSIIASLAPLVVRALDLGGGIDPALERQLRSAMEVANAIMLDTDKRFAAEDARTDERLTK